MFLHKKGCEYYQAIFKNLKFETEKALKNDNSFSVNSCIHDSDINPLPHLTELMKHVENIEKHVASEENILKVFLNKLHSITFIDMKKQVTGPEFTHLSKLVNYTSNLDKLFLELKRLIQENVDMIHKLKDNNNNSSAPLIDYYKYISDELGHIHRLSSDLAREIQAFTVLIEKEKELILKEEQEVTDFNKNFNSWFI